ncbi:uncharacterized protein METZ01_LOCUS230847, partial [marine metagenome]
TTNLYLLKILNLMLKKYLAKHHTHN